MGMATVEYEDPDAPVHRAWIENIKMEGSSGLKYRTIEIYGESGKLISKCDGVFRIVAGNDRIALPKNLR